jgi:thiol-disulfide isomerase/thioredoxin
MRYINKISKRYCPAAYLLFPFILMVLFTTNVKASNDLSFEIQNEQISVKQYPASGKQLVVYVAPGFGFNERARDLAKQLSDYGIEVWMVDLIDNFFLPRGSKSMRGFDGRYVAGIIDYAHKITGKNITLLTYSYGAVPVLRGVRQWQLNNPKLDKIYLNGAILFSPELYHGIPALGDEPDFEPITSATNIPIMIYQSELRNNRWQLNNIVKRLEKNHAAVFKKILPNIASYFYRKEDAPDSQTVKILQTIPGELVQIIDLLEALPTPLEAAPIVRSTKPVSKGLDSTLKKYSGNKRPQPFDLQNIHGGRVIRKDFIGKVTIVNFWATWCTPCVKEIPMLNRLMKEMKDYSFEIMSINFGEEKSRIIDFMKKVDVDFPVLLDEKGRVAGKWNAIVLPSSYVIGPDGRFAYAVNAAIEWDNPEVVEALKKLANHSQQKNSLK